MTGPMPVPVSDAIAVAVALAAAPDRADVVRASRMPEGVLDVIRVAAGDVTLGEEIAARVGVSRRDLEDACAHFAHAVMFHPDADYFQVLGVAPDADEDLLKQHFRWLLKWLHPDRDPEGWVSTYAERVNIAWNCLRRADRRIAYRSEIASSPPAEPVAISQLVAAGHHRQAVFEGSTGRLVPSRLISVLPVALVGVIVVAAIGLLAAHRAGQNLLAEEASRTGSETKSEARGAATDSPLVLETANSPPVVADPMPARLPPAARESPEAPPVVDVPAPAEPVTDAGTPARVAQKTPSPPVASAAAPAVSGAIRQAGIAQPRAEPAPPPIVARTLPDQVPRPSSPTLPPVPRPVPIEIAPVVAAAKPSNDPPSVVDSGGIVHGHVPAPTLARQDSAPPEGSRSLPESPALAAAPADSPGVAQPVTIPPVVAVGADDSRAVRDLLGRFSAAYRAGDARSLVVLFRPNAVTPYGNLLDFNDRYGQVVARSSRRSLEFLELTMRPTERGIEAIGRYELALGQARGGGVEATAGDARVLIEFEGGRPLIAAMEL